MRRWNPAGESPSVGMSLVGLRHLPLLVHIFCFQDVDRNVISHFQETADCCHASPAIVEASSGPVSTTPFRTSFGAWCFTTAEKSGYFSHVGRPPSLSSQSVLLVLQLRFSYVCDPVSFFRVVYREMAEGNFALFSP